MRTRRKRGLLLLCMMLSAGMMLFCTGCGRKTQPEDETIRIGVSIYDQYDTFLSQLMEYMNRYVAEKKNDGMQISVLVYDAAASQKTQNEQVQQMIEEGCRVMCINLVDRTAPTSVIDQARKHNIPVIFFNRELVEEDLMQWDQLYYVGADAFQSGILQGELAVSIFEEDPSLDRNGDGAVQYVVLEGEAGHQDAIIRTEYSVKTMIDKGIPVDKIGYAIANWNRSQAQTKMSQMIDEYREEIELVLANNDDMALGAIDAYQALDIPAKERPVILGIDGTDVGLEAVRTGELAGTVYNDKEGQARAIVDLACALITGEGKEELSLTDGKYIRLPYELVTAENAAQFRNR